jgi:hypothetical protein
MVDPVKVQYSGPGTDKRTMLVTVAEADRLIKTGLWKKAVTKTSKDITKEVKNG